MGQRIRYFSFLLVTAAAFFAAAFAWADIYEPPTSYYGTATATDAALLGQLRTIVSSMTGVNYGDARFSAPYTDPDPGVSGNILLIYDRQSMSGVWDNVALPWNREHIWPQSKLGASASNGVTNIASDQFNLRPAETDLNEDRGNLPFGVDNTSGGFSFPTGYFYPGDADAGDVARSQFYMATRWSALSLTDNTSLGSTQMGDLSSLINYHFKDVPDTFERRRNHAIYGLAGAPGSPAITNPYKQSNRNPFVDHPEWVWPVFKTTLVMGVPTTIPNTSQITIAGGTAGGDGATTQIVDFGRVFVGGTLPPVTANFTLNRSGVDGTYFEVTTAGEATSSLSGRFNAFKNSVVDSKSITVGLSSTTASPGLKTGTVTINNLDITNTEASGQGVGDDNDVFNVSLAVLDHARPSFEVGSEVTSLMYNFGSFDVGDPVTPFTFDVFNYAPTFTADLDFDSIMSMGDTSAFSTDLDAAAGVLTLDPGDGQGFNAMFDTSAEGMFEATYTLSFSDEDIVGALTKTLTLTLMGEVEAAAALLFGDYNRDNIVDAADYTVWRNTFGTGVAEDYDGADGDGDMMIGPGDYDVWKQNYGNTAEELGAGGLTETPAPEPSSLALAIAATLLWGWNRRRGDRPL